MNNTLEKLLKTEAKQLAKLLKQSGTRIVFAESCTGGLVSATLASIPGISENLCGSAVVYRNDTKHRWLNISNKLLKSPGPVSGKVTVQLAKSALKKTSEAHLATAVTGYLGPDAPKGELGHVFIAVAARGVTPAFLEEFWLSPGKTYSKKKDTSSFKNLREKRQMLASHAVLFLVRSLLRLTVIKPIQPKPRRRG